MSLDERGYTILQRIVDNPEMTGTQLGKELNLTRKQIAYAIEKINYYLINNGYNHIQRIRTGKFLASNDVVEAFHTKKLEGSRKAYKYTQQERVHLICLLLLQHEEELSIYHFSSIFKISKNTVLQDMRVIRHTMLQQHDLEIGYNRQKGYYMMGKEYEKRSFIIHIIRDMIGMLQGEEVMRYVLCIKEEELQQLRMCVEQVEQQIHVRYTDERIKEMPYILSFIFWRIHRKQLLDTLPEEYYHSVGTHAYTTILDVFDKYPLQYPMENMFLVSQFQISSISSEHTALFEDEVRHTASLMLETFEHLACIKFKDPKSLLEACIQHLKPAIYRIRYHYPIKGNILHMMLPQHSYLHEITRHTIQPLEAYIGQCIPEEELAYITILFGAWLTKEGRLDVLEKKYRAIVVCTNGISVSNFLFISLSDCFPEFDFVTTLSLREFQAYEPYYDLVFTTVYLPTSRPQFLVRPIMSEFELANIRKNVFQAIMNIKTFPIGSTNLYKTIAQFAHIHNKKGLLHALKTYLGETMNKDIGRCGHNEKEHALTTLLTTSKIILSQCTYAWKDAIKMASKPLLRANCIQECYVQHMIQVIQTKQPFWMIADGFMLAHAGIDEGVLQLGMSMLKMPKKISINGYMEVSMIVVIATPNRTIHLKALYDLIDVTQDKVAFHQLKRAKTKEQMLTILAKERNYNVRNVKKRSL